jgi:MFS-type transporter involved in bile tolerance (Atg22 family)
MVSTQQQGTTVFVSYYACSLGWSEKTLGVLSMFLCVIAAVPCVHTPVGAE